MCITHLKSQYAAHCFSSKTHCSQIIPRGAIPSLSKLLMSPILYALIPLLVEHTDVRPPGTGNLKISSLSVNIYENYLMSLLDLLN